MRFSAGCRLAVPMAAVFGIVSPAGRLAAQPPEPPPRLLPAAVTGTPAGPVQPAAASQPPAAAPAQRFADLHHLPPDTVQAVYAVRAGADWLRRMNQPNGRFVPGLNPSLKQAVGDDPDVPQAAAALGLSRAARFTGDERFAAPAAQAVLTLLSLTKPDPADPLCRVPVAAAGRVGFASLLALAIYDLPGADTKLLADAGALTRFVRAQCRADGAVAADGADAGLALQALAAAHRAAPDPATRDAITRAVGYYAGWFQGRPEQMPAAAALLPAFAECAGQFRDDGARALAVRLADSLCDHQLTPATAGRRGWVGGFAANGEAPPVLPAAAAAGALAAACKLSREQGRAGDLGRYGRHREACLAGLKFSRGVQFTDESAAHFEKGFRTLYLVGGVHLSPADGTIRADATAAVVLAHLRFLESGAEGRE